MAQLTTVHTVLLSLLLILLYLYLSSYIASSASASSSSTSVSPLPSPPPVSSHSFTPSSFTPASATFAARPHLDGVDVYALLPPSSHPLSSTGEVYFINGDRGDSDDDYLSYPLCSFTHVCVHSSSLIFRFPNRTEWQRNSRLIADCFNSSHTRRYQYDLCQCFYAPELVPSVLPWELIKDEEAQTLELRYPADRQRAGRPLRRDGGSAISPDDGALPNTQFLSRLPDSDGYYDGLEVGQEMAGSSPPILSGHYWSVHKYVARVHHIGHWAQRVVLMSAIFQHSLSLPLPPVSGLIIQDTQSPLSPHEQAILNASLYSLLTQQDHPLLAQYLSSPPLPNQLILNEQLSTGWAADSRQLCVERLSFVKMFGVFSTNSHDTMAFRAVAYKQFGITGLSHRCPPRRITLMTRDNRRILNQQLIVDWIRSEFGKQVSVMQIDDSSTPAQQVEAFASTGLMLASHSSQLVNVMFSHPRSAMVEIAPEYYNSDFSEYAHGMGVFFRYALGGDVPSFAIADSMRRCLDMLAECEGDSFCILLKRFEPACKHREVCCKYKPGFNADLQQVKQAVQQAINHLNWACGEIW